MPDPTTQGAPFDPCKVITWSDFPEGARDPQQPRPLRGHVDPKLFGARCVFEASKPSQSNPNSNVLLAAVLWYKPGQLHLGAAANPPSTEHTYAGKAGWRKEESANGVHSCISYVILAGNNVGAVGAINTRYPDVAPCDISDRLTEILAQRVN